MTSSEKFCLKWNDFEKNVSTAFKEIRGDFCDVTLVGEGGRKIDAHKVILAASSNWFKNLLKQTMHPHPLLYMKGVNGKQLFYVLDFLYDGEVNIYQEDLDEFLKVADELQLKGLTGVETENKYTENHQTPSKGQPKKNILRKDSSSFIDSSHNIVSDCPTGENKFDVIESNELVPSCTTELTSVADNGELNTTIQSMMQKIDGIWNCTQCGKTDKMRQHIKNHIEGKHIEGVSHPCNYCGKMFRSTNSLANHRSISHKTK